MLDAEVAFARYDQAIWTLILDCSIVAHLMPVRKAASRLAPKFIEQRWHDDLQKVMQIAA